MSRKKVVPSDAERMASHLTQLGEGCFAIVADVVRDHWTEDSPAGNECSADGSFAELCPTPNARPVTDAQLSAVSNLVLLGAQLRGMAATLTSNALPSVLSLTRIATAAACYTSWLLEPDVEPIERARRNVNAHLAGIADRQRIVGRGRNAQHYRTEDVGRRQFLEWGRRHGLEPVKVGRAYDRVQQWALAPETPNEMELVRYGLDGFGDAMPDALYRLASAFVHSSSNAMLLMTSGVAGMSKHAVPQGRVSLSVGRLALFVAGAVYATHHAVNRTLTQFGRDTMSWTVMADPILKRFGEAAQAELTVHPAIFG
jgi:hypothetical protein